MAGLLFGLLFCGLGAVLVTDFKGFAAWHARTSVLVGRPLRHLPPWRWLPARTLEQDVRFARRMERFAGAGFLVVGILVAVSSLAELL